MSLRFSTAEVTAMLEARQRVPMRHWHPTGYMVSVAASLVMAVAVGVFFMGAAGWSPPSNWNGGGEIAVSWILLSYIWIQMGSLVLTGAGTRHQMWIDALTSIIPLFLIFYVLLQHYSGYVVLSSFQAGTAWLTAYTLLLDLVVDLGVSVLLSRQVVEVGSGGVL